MCLFIIQSYMICARDRKEHLNAITLLKESLRVAQESEQKLRIKFKEKQETIAELQDTLSGLMKIKDENDELKNEIVNLQELVQQERAKNKTEEQKWNEERENIITSNRDELENIKKIRNLEVSSLNREISRIQDEHHQKIEFLNRELKRVEDDCKRTVANYEEKLTRLSRDLISAQSELKNLRLINSNNNINVYNVDNKPTKERYIPQPLSYSRFKPLVPVISTASQLYEDSRQEKSPQVLLEPKEVATLPITQTKKKRKLYNRSDDFI